MGSIGQSMKGLLFAGDTVKAKKVKYGGYNTKNTKDTNNNKSIEPFCVEKMMR